MNDETRKNLVNMTIEHASSQANIAEVAYQQTKIGSTRKKLVKNDIFMYEVFWI
jgi:galactitol-specific phosphotransferase system IIB component